MFGGTSQVDIWEKSILGGGDARTVFRGGGSLGAQGPAGGQHMGSGLGNGER